MAFPDLDPNHVFRDFTTHGVPASGKWDPRKAEIRRLLKGYESAIIALIGGEGGDIDLVRGVIYFSVTGGTANDIIAEPDADLPENPGSTVYIIGGIAQDNTGPVTINGKSLLTNSGNEIEEGGLVAGGIYLFLDDGTSFRLVSDQASAAVLAAAEAAAEAAQDAAEVAENAAGSVQFPVSYGIPQSLSTPQYLQAQANIGVAGPISLMALGAKGDGSDFEDVSTLNAAMLAAASSGVRVFDGQDKTYRINGSTSIIVPSGCVFQGAFFDTRDATAGHKLFSLPGTRDAAIALTADALWGAYELTVASTSGLTAGDVIFIGSTDNWSSTVQTVKRGELVEVHAVVDATTILITKPLDDNYLVAHAAYIRRLAGDYRHVTIREIEAIGMGGGGEQYGIDAQYSVGLRIADVTFDGFDDRGINVLQSYNTRIENPSIKRCRRTSLAYSVAIMSGSADTEITGGRFRDARHGVTFGGSDGVCRDGRVISCVTEGIAGGFDAHPGGAHITFENCTAIGDRRGELTTADQFSLNGYDIWAINCSARHGIRNGFNLSPQVDFPPNGYNTGGLINCRAEGGEATPFNIENTSVKAPMRGVTVRGCKAVNAKGGQNLLVRGFLGANIGGPIYGTVIDGFVAADSSIRGIRIQSLGGTSPGDDGHVSETLIVNPYIKINPTGVAANFRPLDNVNSHDITIVGGRLECSTGMYAGTNDNKLSFVGVVDWSGSGIATTASEVFVASIIRGRTTVPTLTIDNGAITLPLGVDSIIVDTEGGAATDDLTDINGGYIGRRLSLRTAVSARDVVIKNDSAKIGLGADFLLNHAFDRLTLEHDGIRWVRVSSADNGS